MYIRNLQYLISPKSDSETERLQATWCHSTMLPCANYFRCFKCEKVLQSEKHTVDLSCGIRDTDFTCFYCPLPQGGSSWAMATSDGRLCGSFSFAMHLCAGTLGDVMKFTVYHTGRGFSDIPIKTCTFLEVR